MRLNENFHIKSISKPRRRNIKDTYTEYKFKYLDRTVQLDVGFDLEAFTQNGTPIYNFGYGLDIYKYINDEYKNLLGYHDGDDGRITKRYFDCKESRGIINKFVSKSLDRDINNYKFPVFVRGPLTKFKQNSDRYKSLDQVISKYGYRKLIIPVTDMNNYVPHEHAVENVDEDVYWFYICNNVYITVSELCNLDSK